MVDGLKVSVSQRIVLSALLTQITLSALSALLILLAIPTSQPSHYKFNL